MKRIFIIVIIIAAALGAAGAWLPYSQYKEKMAVLKQDIKCLITALELYKNDFGSFPSGDNAQIMRAISGENIKKKAYIESSQDSKNPQGELLDPWRTPYLILITDSQPVIASAGSAKNFDSTAIILRTKPNF